MIEVFQISKVDALVLCPLDLGDERFAVKIAEKLGAPQGFVHHASVIHGEQRAALLQACKFLDIEPVVVE